MLSKVRLIQDICGFIGLIVEFKKVVNKVIFGFRS